VALARGEQKKKGDDSVASQKCPQKKGSKKQVSEWGVPVLRAAGSRLTGNHQKSGLVLPGRWGCEMQENALWEAIGQEAT